MAFATQPLVLAIPWNKQKTPGGPETPKRAVLDKIKGAEGYGLGKARGQGVFFSKGVVFHGGVFLIRSVVYVLLLLLFVSR